MLPLEEHLLQREVAAIHSLENGVEPLFVALLVNNLPPLCHFETGHNWSN